MKILTISNAPWDDRNSVGNTQSNWFSNWPNTEIRSMYTREAYPNNTCCSSYYRVTIKDIAKHIFSREEIGSSISHIDISTSKKTIENNLIGSVKGWKRSALQNIVEIAYSSKLWLNKKLKTNIEEFCPDIIFCFAIAEPFRYNIIRYAKKHTKAKVVMWVADDVYGQTTEMNFFKRVIYRKRYRKMFAMADKVYGVSQMLCEEYTDLYNISITPLYKGCDLAPNIKSVGNPIKIVYAGNLLYGRDKTLVALVSEIAKINKEEIKIQLSIYSGTPVTNEIRNSLNINGSSVLYDARPYDEIKKIMKEADIVLHVESFDKQQMKNVRLSFSTKIIDCMQSGAVMMVIGPKGIASVEYPRGIRGVVVVDDLSKLHQSINTIIKNPSQLLYDAEKIYDYAKRNHELSAVRNKLQKDFHTIIVS